MQRDLAPLTARTFDVLVVGGGISGLTIACDASQRGLSVALIDQHDFGSGNSFNHLRTIHGGLRYLQSLDIRRARLSMRERRALARIAPFALRPQPFVLPLNRSLARGRLAFRAGFLLDQLAGAGRNNGVPRALKLPRGRVISRQEAMERFPAIPREGLTGAAVWYDYAVTEADRLTFAWALAAHAHSAVLANYVEALGPIGSGNRVEGVRAVDTLTGATLDIAAKLTINAAGAARVRLAPGGQVPPLLLAMNLVTRREAGDAALGARTSSGRTLIMLPWKGRALFGTWESSGLREPDRNSPSQQEVTEFIKELNSAFPSLDLAPGDVTLVHRGFVPAIRTESGGVTLDGRDRLVDHAASSPHVQGLLTVAAAKYTTARALAERTVDLAMTKLGMHARPCRTAAAPLPGGDVGNVPDAIANAQRTYDGKLPPASIAHLVAAYGSRFHHVADLALQRDEWRTPLAADSPVIGAQIVHAVRNEMAITLADAVIRRTPLGAVGCPDEAALQRAAAIMAAECGWTADRQNEEIRQVRRVYELPA